MNALARAMTVVLPRRFDAARADGLEATFELRVRPLERRRPVVMTLEVADGHCRVRDGAPDHPGAVATVMLEDMMRLAAGRVGWPELLSAGRLELRGDPFLALRFPLLFRLPATRRT